MLGYRVGDESCIRRIVGRLVENVGRVRIVGFGLSGAGPWVSGARARLIVKVVCQAIEKERPGMIPGLQG